MEMSKTYESVACEKVAQELWAQENIHKFMPDDKKQTFSLDTPPPTVSGALHVGHVFSYTHQDLIARYKRMRGFNVFYPMGFDDNGLATERFVEKKHGIKGHLMKRSEFVTLCRKEAQEVEKEFEKLFRALGFSIDWTKGYSTISPEARRISQYSFIDLYKKGFIYRKYEPALYCTTCRTSVAQAEVDNAEVTSQFNDITFMVAGKAVTVATTRPELLPACVALFYHPDDTRYQALAGLKAEVPVFKQMVPVLTDDRVDPTKGTGLVMCCTFGDQNDIYWFKIHKLPFVQVVGFDGKWTVAAGPLAGLNVHDARKKVIELLRDAGALVGQKAITHSVNTHERCKQELEYQILTQWFVKILEFKDDFLKLADQINWYPEFMKARYRDWVEHLNWDWVISRQRYSGVPFPVWHCQSCSEVLLADAGQLPVDPQEVAYPGGVCSKCGGTNIVPDTDVMDTWNTSSLTPQVNLHWPDRSPDALQLPMSLRLQAHDIIRTWAFYTIVKAYYHHKTIPWKNIMMSGHVLAGKEKISKSQGNSKLTPEALLATYPADVIRYWAASGRLGTDTAFSENQLKIGQRLVTKLWNAVRFCSQHLEAYQPSTTRPALDPLNEWVLHHLGVTVKAYVEHFDAFEYYAALEKTEAFFWQIFCDNYLELIKDQLFTPENYSAGQLAATRYTLYQVGYGVLQLFAPFLPHLTETLYQQLFKIHEKAVSLHVTSLDLDRYRFAFETGAKVVDMLVGIVGTVRKIKSEKQLSLKVELEALVIHAADTQVAAGLKPLERILMGVTNAKALLFDPMPIEQPVLEQTPAGLVAHVVV